MTWPSSDVTTTNTDAGTDSPATARSDILDLMTKLNLLRNHVSAFMQGILSAANAAAARASLGAAEVGANATVTSLTALQSINGGSIGGLRNRLLNGAMAIDQRNLGYQQTIVAGSSLAYTVDRWYAYCTGATVNGQRVAGSGANQYRYQFTGAASVTKIGFAQRIEKANCIDLAGSTATLSVDLSNSLLTTVTWTAWYATTDDTFGTLASPTRTQISTGAFTVNSTVNRYSTQIAIPGAATTGIEIEFSVGAQTSGTWVIARAQLEPGATASAFEGFRPEELALCQRYAAPLISYGAGSTNPYTRATVGLGLAISTTEVLVAVPLSVVTRWSAPSIIGYTLTPTSASGWTINDGVTNFSATAVSIINNNSTPNVVMLHLAVASGLTQYRSYFSAFNADNSQSVLAVCEL